jgi:hypothetical protein
MTIAEGKQVMYHGHVILCLFLACASAAESGPASRTL